MTATNNKIELMLNQNGKRGVVMIRENYLLLSEFILKTIGQRKQIRMSDLLEKASRQLFAGLEANLCWHVLQVKLDLEARGFITTNGTARLHRLPFLKLTRKGEKAIKGRDAIGVESFQLVLLADE